MPQSLSCVIVHVVFSTKNRAPCLADVDSRIDLHAFLGGISRQLGCQPIAIGGVEDHVHVLAHLSRTVAVSEWVKELKRVSNQKMRGSVPDFAWQAGYGAFSVDPSRLDSVAQYVRSQEEHHRRETFQDEFLRLLNEHDLTWDERYVWD